MRLTLLAIAMLLPTAAFAQSGIPTVDIKNTCKLAASAMVQLLGGTTAGNDQEICLGSEQRAREQIVKDWSTYSSTDRSRCVRTNVYLPSYVEWLTCLEMERDVRKMQIETPDATAINAAAPMTMPVVRPGVLW
jgi:hypothetical protein